MRSTRWPPMAAGSRDQVSIFIQPTLFSPPWDYSPNTKRPNWSPNCLTCSGSWAARKRSANRRRAWTRRGVSAPHVLELRLTGRAGHPTPGNSDIGNSGLELRVGPRSLLSLGRIEGCDRGLVGG
jgi:hypothetical protein